MYPNQGPPNPYGGGYNPYPNAAPFGAGMPPQQGYPGMPPQQPYGSGYPGMAQPGMPQPGMPQPGMPQPGMPQSGMPQPGMPQPFNYQSPPIGQAGYPGQPAPQGYPPQQGFQAPQSGYPGQPQQQGFPPQQAPAGYPQTPQGNYGMPQEQMIQQQQYSQQNTAYAAPPQQQAYGAPPHQQAYGAPAPTHQPTMGRPTVTPAPNFNAATDAAVLRKAMKGFGTDEDAIIEVLCRRSNAQRINIVYTYKTAYGKDLIEDIRSESSGNFQRVLVTLLTPTTELYARELNEAMCGAGTEEDVLIEVMCTMTNREIREVCFIFNRLFGRNLERELQSDTSGTFKRLMTSLSCGSRDESMVTDINAARIDAQELKRAGVDKWGTDESAFNRVLCLRNYEQIKLIAQEYEKLAGNSLEKDIKREFSGDIEDGLLAILRVAQSRPEFFARALHKSMAGLGTNDNSLIRLVVSRCEIDMVDVKEAFMRLFGKTLKSFIKGDCSGHYKHALYALIGENRS